MVCECWFRYYDISNIYHIYCHSNVGLGIMIDVITINYSLSLPVGGLCLLPS